MMRQVVWSALVEGLHAQVFGVYSFDDPQLSHRALSDEGVIHEAVHALIRELPSIENGTVDQRPDDIPQSAWDAAEGRSREDVARMIAGLYLLKQRACAAHKLCYELMLIHPEIAELDDNGTLHQAIHDILRVETPILAAYRAE